MPPNNPLANATQTIQGPGPTGQEGYPIAIVPATGSGGMAVTIADGADVAQGSTTDAAVGGDAAGTLNAHLRGLTKVFGTVAAGLLSAGIDTSAVSVPTFGAGMMGLSQGATTLALIKCHDSGSDARVTTINGLVVQACNYLFNGSTQDRQRAMGTTSGAAATGIAATGLYVYNGTTFDPVRGSTSTVGKLLTSSASSGGIGDATSAGGMNDELGSGRVIKAEAYSYNGTNSDRDRNNTDVTLLTSAARTTTQTSTDITTYNAGAIVVILDMTNVAAGPSVTVSIDGKDPASGKWINLLTGAAVTTVTTNAYTVDPNLPAVANVTAQKRVPRTIRIVVTANNANSGTYSVGYWLLPVA